jgi:phosphoglucan,water dikinase
MAVLIQELLSPTFSFVLHTASPMGNDPATAEFEVAAGLGETLASGKRGSAWRIAVNKSTGAVKTLAFANFSEAMLPAGAGRRTSSPSPELAGVASGAARAGGLYSRSGSMSRGGEDRPGSPMSSIEAGGISSSGSGSLYDCSTRVIDYSKQKLTVSADARVELAQQIGAVASCMERAFGGAQDVEGCWVGDELYVVQTRPQP